MSEERYKAASVEAAREYMIGLVHGRTGHFPGTDFVSKNPYGEDYAKGWSRGLEEFYLSQVKAEFEKTKPAVLPAPVLERA